MALPKTEDFAGSANYTVLTSHNASWISTNTAFRTLSEAAYAGGTGLVGWTGDTFADDQYAEATVDSLNASRLIGVAVHINASGTDNGYYFRGNTTGVYGGEVVSGTATDTSGSGSALSVSDVMRLEVTVSGSTATLTPYINATEVTAITPWTSTAFTSGDAGMSTNNGGQSARLDDWEGGDLTASVTSTLSGTMTSTVDEDDITTGGKTIIVTLSGDTFKAAGTGPIGSTADTQALIDGFSAASSPTNGWNNEVRDKALTSEVVRTSSTVATWTVAAQSGYDISSQEVITGTIPVSALVTGAGAVVSAPTFTIDQVSGISMPVIKNHLRTQGIS